MTRRTPWARNGLPSGPANQRPVSSTQSLVSDVGIGPHAILNLIGDAVAFVAFVRLHDGVEARLRVVRLEDAGHRRGRSRPPSCRGSAAPRRRSRPRQDIGVDAPVVGDLADRSEDLRGVERTAGRGAPAGASADLRRDQSRGPALVKVISSEIVAVRGAQQAPGRRPSYRRSLNNSESLAAASASRHAACELRGKGRKVTMSRFGTEEAP